MALVAAPSSWTHSLPYHHAAHHHAAHTPLRPQSATWNTKFPSMPSASTYSTKPRLRLAVQVVVPAVEEKRPAPPPLRFDPFADEPPVASTSQLPPATQNTPPARGRTPTPLSIAVPAPTPSSAPATPPPTGRRRAPSFSAGSGAALPRSLGGLSSLTRAAQLYPHNLHPASSHSSPHSSSSHPVYNASSNSYSLCSSAPSPAPSLARSRSPQPPPPPPASASGVANAPSAFHARHYPTPDARARLLARTLLTRIHAVGRPRGASAALYSCAKSSSSSRKNGYESACGARGTYVPSRLRECTVAC